jgi:hypothetical protein
MYKISLRLCFSTIAADVVICADCHDKKKWILGRLFDACVLLRIFSWLPYGDVIAQQVFF